jgi:hypothetical protein
LVAPRKGRLQHYKILLFTANKHFWQQKKDRVDFPARLFAFSRNARRFRETPAAPSPAAAGKLLQENDEVNKIKGAGIISRPRYLIF